MRLSLLEHEAQQRRETEQRAREGAEDSSSQTRTESRNSPLPPPPAETSSSDIASSTVARTVTPPVSNHSPSSNTPNTSNLSLPNPHPQPLSESPPNDTVDLEETRRSFQPSPLSTTRIPALSRMDSLASSVSPNDLDTGLEGYRFLSSESEESVIAREPLLHLEESDA